jgi:hypothetical protein
VRKRTIVLGSAGIFLLGALASFLVTRQLYLAGAIFQETYVPNPVLEAANKGHYDEAIQAALAQIHDEKQDYWQYGQIATVDIMRAYKDEPNRDRWAQQAASYIDKMADLAPDEPGNLFEAAYGYERAGDLSKNGCPCYEKGLTLCQRLNSLLQSDSLMVKDWKFPTKHLREDNERLQKRLKDKVQSWCQKSGP